MNLIYTFGYTDTETSTVSKYNDLDIFFIFSHIVLLHLLYLCMYMFMLAPNVVSRAFHPHCVSIDLSRR